MDPTRFDSLVRAVGATVSRRGALAALLAGFVAPGLPDAEGAARQRGNGTGKGKAAKKRKKAGSRKGSDTGQRGSRQDTGGDRTRARSRGQGAGAEAVRCCSSGACTPGAGKNLATCCYVAQNLADKNFKSANLGNANFTRATLTRAKLTGANLGKACLVDANLTGAKLNGSTNLAGAIFCRTTMPDGSRNNGGCGQATACCETCNTAIGASCAAGDLCCGGATCQNAICACPAGQTDCGGVCKACCADRDCPGATPRCCDGVCRGCCADGQCERALCCNGSCCAAGQVCDTRDDPGACCTPLTSCPAGKICGRIADGCGGSIACGSCPDDAPICARNACRGCASNEECGAAGRGNLCCGGACFDGECCGSEACANPKPLCVDHTCTVCSADHRCPSGCCDGGRCVAACPSCTTCNGEGQCVPCPGCCDSAGACQPGDSNTACGRGNVACLRCGGFDTCGGGGTAGICGCTPRTTCPSGKNCGTMNDGCGGIISCGRPCGGSTPVCVDNTCIACSANAPCPGSQRCCGGACVSGVCCEDGDCAPTGSICMADHACRCGASQPCAGDAPACCGAGNAGQCTNTQTDRQHCGACGRACPDGQRCWNGSCVCGDVCPSGCQFTSVQAAVNAARDGATIRICAGTYHDPVPVARLSHIEIDKNLTLIGDGAGADPVRNTILDAAGSGPLGSVIDIRPGREVTLRGLRVINGFGGEVDVGGGGIVNRGTLTMANCTVAQSGARDWGGGILNTGGRLTMTDCAVTGNYTDRNAGGGIANRSGGVLIMTRCAVASNQSRDWRGGGIANDGGGVALTQCEISDNTSRSSGGGIYSAGGTLTMATTKLRRNDGSGTVEAEDATVFMSDCEITDSRRGGGLALFGSTTTMKFCSVLRNTSTSSGAGILVGGGDLWIEDSFVSDNTIGGNSHTDHGGGIYNISGKVTLVRSFVSNNTVPVGRGGGLFNAYNPAARGEIHLEIATQVFGNRAGALPLGGGGGIYNDPGFTGEPGSVTISGGSVVSGNTPDNCAPASAVNCTS